jgi:hypothetical protein
MRRELNIAMQVGDDSYIETGNSLSDSCGAAMVEGMIVETARENKRISRSFDEELASRLSRSGVNCVLC